MLGWEDTSSIPTLDAMPAWLGVLGSHVVTSQAGRQHYTLQGQDCELPILVGPLAQGPRHRDHMSHIIRSTFIDRQSRNTRTPTREATGADTALKTAACAGDARASGPRETLHPGPQRVSLAGWKSCRT